MDSENELIVNKLAQIRDEIFGESDFVSNEGYDMLPSYAASPYEVLCGIETKIKRQQKLIEGLKEEFEDQTLRANTYFKELQTYKSMYEEKQKEVDQLKNDIEKVYELYCDI